LRPCVAWRQFALGGGVNAFEHLLQTCCLVVVEDLDEPTLDLLRILGPHAPEQRRPLACDRNHRSAAVVRARLPPDETGSLEAVDQTCQPAAADRDDLRRELAHAELPARGTVERPEHVVPGERRQPSGLKRLLGALNSRGMCIQECPPGIQVGLRDVDLPIQHSVILHIVHVHILLVVYVHLQIVWTTP
jgi:hypothetical protein